MSETVRPFRLSTSFLDAFVGQQPEWGPVGYIAYKRTYARRKDDGTSEEFWETCRRVVEGCYYTQKQHCNRLGLVWDNQKAQRSAQEMFLRMWAFKWLPPGRGLWMMGTPYIDRAGAAALNNCGFVSTEGIAVDLADPFCWLMDMLMLGVGVGFDTKGAGLIKIQEPRQGQDVFVVEDSREGWVALLRRYITAYSGRGSLPASVDYSHVRPAGEPIHGFGGTASGPDPLVELIDYVQKILNPLVGESISTTAIVDICNLIGRCVVAGNVRRSAEIAFGEPEDTAFRNLKNPDVAGDALMHHRWASNNSVFARVGMDYTELAEMTAKNGEPGFEWLENAQDFSRMGRPPTYKDRRAKGGNPCVTSDTMIHTTKGPRQAWALEGEQFTAIVDGKPYRSGPSGFWCTGKKEVFEVKTHKGYAIKATANHRFLVVKNGERQWVAVEDLKKDDLLVLSNDRSLASWGDGCSRDFSEGYLVGHILGDGTLKRERAVFSVWEKDGPGIVGMMEEVCKGIAALDIRHRADWKGWTLVSSRGELRLNSTPLRDYFLNEFGMDWVRKRPNLTTVERHNSEFARGFLRGLFDTDGSVQGNQKNGVSIRLAQTDLELMQVVQRLLLRLGIVSNLYENRQPARVTTLPDGHGGSREYSCKACHDLIIANDSLHQFAEIVGFSHKDKQDSLLLLLSSYKRTPNRDKFTAKVTGVTSAGVELVYDAEISEVHAFSANGIVVHNCLEQTLEDRELCCVSGDTRILTRDGYPRIADVVGKSVDVWNGKTWSTVTPFLASRNKKLYRVNLSDGSYLDVTDNHGWSVRPSSARKFRRVDTVALKPGMRLESCEPPAAEGGVRAENAYQVGWVVGDGFVDGNKVMALVQEPEYTVLSKLGGVAYKEQHPSDYARPFRRVNVTSSVPLELGLQLRDSSAGLPDELFAWNRSSLSEFFGAWIDADGTVRRQQSTDNYVLCSTSEQKLRDAQILLRRLGVNHATVHQWQEAGRSTNYGVRNKALWSLYIPSYEAALITPFLKVAFRFGSRYRTNTAHPNGDKIDCARKQTVISVEELPALHDTFCFTEPHEHKGVFGNCLTYQCLVETFPGRHDNYADYEKTLKYAYLYAKTVTLIPTHDMRTNQVLLRNRRIGASMSGIVQAMKRHGRREFFNWCDNGYCYLRDLDKTYSDWFCIRESIKITSVKPSGTVSLLPGVTPGIHFPHSQFYIRRIRFQEDHPLVDQLKAHGYPVEVDKYSPKTVVASFPVEERFFDRSKDAVSMWEQLEIAAQVQQYWADNQVSITVTFNQREAADLRYALELYETRLKGVSFLPLSEHGYEQAPYESLTEQEFIAMSKNITPFSADVDIQHDITEKFCTTDTCMIDFKE